MSEPYAQTSNGGRTELLSPRPEGIDLAAMAWALAHLNRYTGHAGDYSVAEHLVLGTRYLRDVGASTATQLIYLFHDAHEATTGDVSAPIKKALRMLANRAGCPDIWAVFEAGHEACVRAYLQAYCLTPIPDLAPTSPAICDDLESAAAKLLDLRMLITETDQLTVLGGRVGPAWPNVEAVPVTLEQWSGPAAFLAFLIEVERLAPELLRREGEELLDGYVKCLECSCDEGGCDARGHCSQHCRWPGAAARAVERAAGPRAAERAAVEPEPEPEPLEYECAHEAYEAGGGGSTCADCGVWLEGVGQREKKEQPGSAICACGHAREEHFERGTGFCEHYSHGDGDCDCERFRGIPR